MIDRDHGLPVSRQAVALRVSRSAVYYKPRPTPAADLKIMRRIDELHLDYPFAGSRMLRDFLVREGLSIGRRRVASLMKRMGISAIYRRPNTSKPAPGHKIYPYLLRGVKIERTDQVWATDITYIPMARGFVYLAAPTAGGRPARRGVTEGRPLGPPWTGTATFFGTPTCLRRPPVLRPPPGHPLDNGFATASPTSTGT